MPRRTKTKTKTTTVLDEMFARVGPRKAIKVATFVSAWKIASDRRHHPDQPFTVEAYGAFWNQSNPTTYRDLALFRACFPEFQFPDELIEMMAKQRVDPGLTGFNRARWEP